MLFAPSKRRVLGREQTYVFLWVTLLLAVGCSDSPNRPSGETPDRSRAGGDMTVDNATNAAFSLPAPNTRDMAAHMAGDAAFDAEFVSAPAEVNPGLGPVFSSNSCVSCHPQDGRGRPTTTGDAISMLLLRLSIPGEGLRGGPNPVPGYGVQLGDRALFGTIPEGRISVSYTEHVETLAGGEIVTLRKPEYTITDAYNAFPSDLMISPRIPPPVFGLGLLEAVTEAEIIARTNESDSDGDGISGRPNYVWSEVHQRMMIGRFGWKANAATLRDQAAGAYNQDIGITNPVLQQENMIGQPQHDGYSDDPEINDTILSEVTFYLQTLAVPAPRHLDNHTVRRGEKLFGDIGCASCHTPTMQTGSSGDVPEARNQTFHPFTDLLLHDMGEGLADGRPDFGASGREWRTAPLWGIGLTRIVNGHEFFLHDGRARGLLEAIMWHGGEADSTRERFRALSKTDREALIMFLESL